VRKRPLQRPKRRWEENNKMNIQDVGLDWSGSGYREVADCCKRGKVLTGFIKRGELLD
jgi:hypothetical protein